MFRVARWRKLSRVFLGAVLAATLSAGWCWHMVTPRVGEAELVRHDLGPRLWSFGFVGDTQRGQGIFEHIFEQMANEEVEFCIHLGDAVQHPRDDTAWDYLLGSAAQRGIRLMPVVGNHDKIREYGDTGEIRFRQYYPELPETFYHFRHRGLNFLMLNSERSFAPWSRQGKYLSWELENHPGTTIACLHRPTFTCSPRDVTRQYTQRLFLHARLRESDVSLVLSGHHHYYERSKPLDEITYVVSGGAGYVHASTGKGMRYRAQPNCDDHTAAFESGVYHYGIVDVHRTHLRVRSLGLDGSPIDSFEISIRRAPDGTNNFTTLPSIHNPGQARGVERFQPRAKGRLLRALKASDSTVIR